MYDPVTIRITPKKLTVDAIEQAFVEVAAAREDRPADRGAEGRGARAGDHLLPHQDRRRAARPRRSRDRGLDVKALHGDMSQGQRDGVMIAFKDHRLPLLVATDIAARGLDIEHVTHVINYDVPEQHRDLRAPDRPHRPGRAHRARDHLRDPEAARGDRPDRARGEDLDRRVGGRPRSGSSTRRGRGAASTPEARGRTRRGRDREKLEAGPARTPGAGRRGVEAARGARRGQERQGEAVRQPRRAQRHRPRTTCAGR